MAPETISRKEARAKGLKKFISEVPCKRGHRAWRWVVNNTCLSCIAINSEKVKEGKRQSWFKYHDRNKQKLRDRHKNNPEKYRESSKRWRKNNPGYARISYARLYKGNRAFLDTLKKKRRQNRAAIRERAALRYRKNAAAIRQKSAEWRRNNPDKVREQSRVKRARKFNAPGSHTREDLANIFRMQRNCCADCRVRFSTECPPTLDHIIALAKGGSHYPRNLQFLCFSCNSSKQAQDPIEFARRRGRLL